MIRRHLAVVASTLLAATSLSSCATFDRNDVVASVGDEELTQIELRDIAESDFGRTYLLMAVIDGDLVLGAVPGSSVTGGRDLIGTWAAFAAIAEAGIDLTPTPEAVAQAEANVSTLSGAPEAARELMLRSLAVNDLISQGRREELLEVARAADVHVDSRYGVWSPEALTVLAVGEAPPA